MAIQTVRREIEVKVNMDQLVCGQALLDVNLTDAQSDFNKYTRADKVFVVSTSIVLDGLATLDEDECYDQYIEGSIEKQDCKLKIRLLVDAKAKKYEGMIDDVVEEFKEYLEKTLPSYANIVYAQMDLLNRNTCVAVFG